jgi:pyruvate-ferredoxin/flavodoxin oxidoreductase
MASASRFAMKCSNSVQEVMDLALVSHLPLLRASYLPPLFDGFRPSHELSKIDVIDYEEYENPRRQELIPDFRARALNPSTPCRRGTAQNGDIYFQNRHRATSL